METLKINIPEGYEIDIDNTDLTTGEIKLRAKNNRLPRTWDEFCEQNRYIKVGECFIALRSDIENYTTSHTERNNNNDKNLLPDMETAEAMLVLCQLIQLRDCYNGGWKPSWNIATEKKYIIYFERNDITYGTNTTVSYILSFKTKELRDKFLANFRDLIEIAKPLL